MTLGSYAAVFLLGLITSVGPCAAPRYLTLVALVENSDGKARWVQSAWFLGGLVGCYIALAAVTSWAVRIQSISAFVYAALALSFLLIGLNRLVVRERCEHRNASRPQASRGWLSLVGAALGLVISPCCNPILGLTGSFSAGSSAAAALGSAIAFMIGHLGPVALAACGLGAGAKLLRLERWGAPATTISAALMLALGFYYGLLA